MEGPTLLLADNHASFLENTRVFLTDAGFNVRTAANPSEARAIMQHGSIDLAILDVRLEDDLDPHDTSGLKLALMVAPGIPKILLAEHATFEAARAALGTQLDGLSPATDFVKKIDGPVELLTAVRKALNLASRNRYRRMSGDLAYKLNKDYQDARQQAFWNYWTGLVIALIGAAIIFVGGYLAFRLSVSIAVLSTLAGVIMEVAGILFFRRTDSANMRMDRYHQELFEIRRLENLLEACGELLGQASQERCRERVIEAATSLWLGPISAPSGLSRMPPTSIIEASNKE